MSRGQTASATVKRLKREARGVVRTFVQAARSGDCREAAEALSRLTSMNARIKRIAWSGRPPTVITPSSHERLDHVYRNICKRRSEQ